jgi:hypothetical protein
MPNEVYHGDLFTPCLHANHSTTNAGIYHNIGQGGNIVIAQHITVAVKSLTDKKQGCLFTKNVVSMTEIDLSFQ